MKVKITFDLERTSGPEVDVDRIMDYLENDADLVYEGAGFTVDEGEETEKTVYTASNVVLDVE